MPDRSFRERCALAVVQWTLRLLEWRVRALTRRIAHLTEERAKADKARRLGNELLFEHDLGRRR